MILVSRVRVEFAERSPLTRVISYPVETVDDHAAIHQEVVTAIRCEDPQANVIDLGWEAKQ